MKLGSLRWKDHGRMKDAQRKLASEKKRISLCLWVHTMAL